MTIKNGLKKIKNGISNLVRREEKKHEIDEFRHKTPSSEGMLPAGAGNAITLVGKKYIIDPMIIRDLQLKMNEISQFVEFSRDIEEISNPKKLISVYVSDAKKTRNFFVGADCLLALEENRMFIEIRDVQKHARRLDVRKVANIILNRSGDRSADVIKKDLSRYERGVTRESERHDYHATKVKLESVEVIRDLDKNTRGKIDYSDLTDIAIKNDEVVGAWCIFKLYHSNELDPDEKREYISDIASHADSIGTKLMANEIYHNRRWTGLNA